MTRIVNCVKLKRNAPGLETSTYPGDLGQKIYESISQEAWQQWLHHQTMLINENRLNTLEPEARKFLVVEMERFLFGEGSVMPAGYKPIT